MSFGESFARGYAIGDAYKKRRATSKFFEKFNELTSRMEADETGIPAEVSMAPTAPTAPSPTALPVQPTAVAGATAPVAAATALPAVDVAGPAAIPTGVTPEKQEKLLRSLTKRDMEELDSLARKAGEAAGDPSVYQALQETTLSTLQSKTLRNLSLAQAAATKGDTDTVERYLKKAYRYVPDGQEIEFERKDGKLLIANPWAGQEGQPDQVELSPERIGYLGVMLADPAKYSELLRGERKEMEEAKREERDFKLRERGVAAQEANVAETKRSNQAVESLRARGLDLDEANSRYDNLLKFNQAMRLSAEGAEGQGGALPAGMKPDDARQLSLAAASQVTSFLIPTTETIDGKTKGPVPKGYEIFVDEKTGDLNQLGLMSQEIGGNIAVLNPELGVAAAASAGMEMARALALPDGPTLRVSPANGTITVPIGGRAMTFRVSPQVIAALQEAKPTTSSGPPRR